MVIELKRSVKPATYYLDKGIPITKICERIEKDSTPDISRVNIKPAKTVSDDPKIPLNQLSFDFKGITPQIGYNGKVIEFEPPESIQADNTFYYVMKGKKSKVKLTIIIEKFPELDNI